jgi:hypothetical protein
MKAAISEGVGVYGLDKDVLKMKRPTTMPRDKRRNQSWYPPSTRAAKQTMDNRRSPMQTIYKSLQAADLDKLEYVTPHFALDFKQQTRGRSQGWCTGEDVKSLLINGGQIHFGGRTCSGCISPTVAKPETRMHYSTLGKRLIH